ncbi:MAG: rod shape-determining protein MreC [Deltaproteobacteria bacterium]|nr:rod shape-determining protein MreC [Deltaproteobacteria bacterium]
MGFFQRFRFPLLVGFILVGALAFFSFSAGGASGTLAGRYLMEIVGPVQKAVTALGRGADRIWVTYFALVQAARENQQLVKKVDAMRQELADMEEYRLENHRLRNLLGLDVRVKFPVVAAQVVGTDPTGHFRTVIIDRGTAGGVENVMPVIAASGVVGRVVWSSPHYAKVLLLTDPNSGVDVMVQRSRAQGVVEGMGDGRLRLKYVLHSDDVVPGDRLVTSGGAGVFPRGLLVGTVRTVHPQGRRVFLEVEAEPSVDFSRLEEVMVIAHKRRLEE